MLLLLLYASISGAGLRLGIIPHVLLLFFFFIKIKMNNENENFWRDSLTNLELTSKLGKGGFGTAR